MITWASLTGGLIGSVVAGTVTFLVANWTFNRTRRFEQGREDRRDEASADERRRRDIAEVIGILRGVETEVRLAPFMGGRASARSLEATMLFYLNERPRHPLVAEWTLQRQVGLQELMTLWKKRWWVPVARKRRLNQAVPHVAHTVGMLVRWAHGELPDEWFTDPKREPDARV